MRATVEGSSDPVIDRTFAPATGEPSRKRTTPVTVNSPPSELATAGCSRFAASPGRAYCRIWLAGLISTNSRTGCDHPGRKQCGHARRHHLFHEHISYYPVCEAHDADRDHPDRQCPCRPDCQGKPYGRVCERGRQRHLRRLSGERHRQDRPRRGQATSLQSSTQPLSTACQPALHRPQRQTQLLGRLILC